MKNFIKYAAVGLAGYFVGFYELKYRIMKSMALQAVENKENNVKQEPKEESQ